MKFKALKLALLVVPVCSLIACSGGSSSNGSDPAGPAKEDEKGAPVGASDLLGQWSIPCSPNGRRLWVSARLNLDESTFGYSEEEYSDSECRHYITGSYMSGTYSVESSNPDGTRLVKYVSSSSNSYERYQKVKIENNHLVATTLVVKAADLEAERMNLIFSK